MTNATIFKNKAYWYTEERKFNLNMEIMRDTSIRSGVFAVLACSILMAVSCEIIPEEVIRERDLAGTWSLENVTAQVYVGKVNITRLLVVSHGYTSEEAEMILDSLVNEYLEEIGTILVLNTDYTYQFEDEGTVGEAGTWEYDAQKEALLLTKSGEKVPKRFSITHLTQTALTMGMPDRFKVIDLNEDGKNETNCTIVAEIQMVKIQPVN